MYYWFHVKHFSKRILFYCHFQRPIQRTKNLYDFHAIKINQTAFQTFIYELFANLHNFQSAVRLCVLFIAVINIRCSFQYVKTHHTCDRHTVLFWHLRLFKLIFVSFEYFSEYLPIKAHKKVCIYFHFVNLYTFLFFLCWFLLSLISLCRWHITSINLLNWIFKSLILRQRSNYLSIRFCVTLFVIEHV